MRPPSHASSLGVGGRAAWSTRPPTRDNVVLSTWRVACCFSSPRGAGLSPRGVWRLRLSLAPHGEAADARATPLMVSECRRTCPPPPWSAELTRINRHTPRGEKHRFLLLAVVSTTRRCEPRAPTSRAVGVPPADARAARGETVDGERAAPRVPAATARRGLTTKAAKLTGVCF